MRGAWVTLCAALCWSLPVYGDVISAPSGLQVELHETLYEPLGVTASTARIMRLRFVAPDLGDVEEYGIDRVEGDFEWFCHQFGLPRARKAAPLVEQVIVSIASQEVPFGDIVPEVVQYFDAFRIEEDSCIWEGL